MGTGGGLVVLGMEGWTSSGEGLESIFIWGVRGREGRFRARYVQDGWGRGKEGRLWFGGGWGCKIYRTKRVLLSQTSWLGNNCFFIWWVGTSVSRDVVSLRVEGRMQHFVCFFGVLKPGRANP